MALTEWTGLPIWIADLWRYALWAAMAACLGYYLRVLPYAWRHGTGWRRASLFGTTALAMFVLQGFVLTYERVGQPVALEVTPAATIGVVLAVLSARALRREVVDRPGTAQSSRQAS